MVKKKEKEVDEEEVSPQGPQKETPEGVVPAQQDQMQIITQLAGIIQEQQKKIQELENNLNSVMEYLKAQSQQSQPQGGGMICLLYTSPSPRDGLLSRMPSSA